VSCGRSVLAKSINPSRIEENLGLVRLEKAEVAAIQESITERGDGNFVRYVYPEFGVDFGFPDKS
jgi:glycerol 2-dehydrogenase (NADP+)